jgi:hypothetical protein
MIIGCIPFFSEKGVMELILKKLYLILLILLHSFDFKQNLKFCHFPINFTIISSYIYNLKTIIFKNFITTNIFFTS